MANKIYSATEAAVTWKAAGGTELLTLTSVADGVGRNGAIHDFAAGARAHRYRLRLVFNPATAYAAGDVGKTVEVYLRTSDDASIADNDDGVGDVALSSADKLRNLRHLLSVVIDEAADVTMSGSCEFETRARYWGPVVMNRGGKALSSTAAQHFIEVYPVPEEVQ